ncbi:MAG: PD40 domain-containing protein [Bacteroidetes bacterium]|nr:PD40 domain-containing protein [Bacteroidota bacterium]
MKTIVWCFAFALMFLCTCKKPEPPKVGSSYILFREHGLDVSWDQSGSDLIAYSMKESDQYYDIHFAQPDGSNDVCLTCNHPALPNKHIASPYWHPSGKWLLLTVEKASHPGSSADALPGFGAYCDIWIMSKDGSKAYKLVDIPNDYDHGVIAPRFSHDGKHIVWTDRKTQPNVLNPTQTFGFWTIKMADFAFGVSDSMPAISNIRNFEPVVNSFFECYGFSPDDSKIIFCSSMNKPSVWDQHIYTMDTSGKNIIKLTDTDYNEHAFYKPDGSRIVWMTNTGLSSGTDWWIMNPDGSDKKKLSYFNTKGTSQTQPTAVWCGLGSFNPAGSRFVGGMQTSLITQEGKIVIVTLP